MEGSDFLSKLASVEDVKQRINSRVDKLYNWNGTGKLRPYVCCVCDEFILRKKDIRVVSVKKMKAAKDLLSWKRNIPFEDQKFEVEASYVFPNDPIQGVHDRTWLDEMALSCQGSTFRLNPKQAPGFVTCPSCKEEVEKKRMPFYAIVNRHYTGCAPSELTELNDIERSFLTPIASYGYFFTYEGGSMKLMKGTMTFMRVEERKLAKSVTTLECMGLTKHVAVLTSGKMTAGQLEKVKKMTTVQTDKMIAAVKWLCRNNEK